MSPTKANSSTTNQGSSYAEIRTDTTAGASETKYTSQNEPGGLFRYIQSRKKVHEQNNIQASKSSPNRTITRMKYHKLAHIGSSNYLIDVMSDSDDDEPIGRDNAISPPPIFDTPSIEANLTRESWFSSFKKSAKSYNKSLKKPDENEMSTSWMSQAIKTVNDVTIKASDWISTQTDSTSNWALSSVSPYVPSIDWPFTTDNKSILPTSSDIKNTDQNNTLAFLPKLASRTRMSFATKGRNPYQAVLGRDADYLLSSNTAYFWGLGSSGNSWLSWIRNKTMILIEATDETYQRAVERPKSHPSEVSIQAVKNLLLLVEPESSDFKRLQTNSSDTSSHSSLEVPYSPLDDLSNISRAANDATVPEDDDLPAYEQNLSFNSCNSSYGSCSPIRLSPVRPPNEPSNREHSDSGAHNEAKSDPNTARNAEMASRLAEGTLRAYRDLVLDEAVELHSALHYWTLRWERPFLGWLEAGPKVWISAEGHSPYEAARKMSQIQAVLARRCASIGEIQQHLWRATWTKGVANWGMLGTLTGGEWVSVVGGDGEMDDMGFSKRNSGSSIQIFNHPSLVGSNVMNAPGGRIVIDEDAQVNWSIDAMRVIRDQLYRASLGVQALPHTSNWPREAHHFNENETTQFTGNDLPDWAKASSVDDGRATANVAISSSNTAELNPNSTIITNLPQMAEEVESLLESIEINLCRQRNRRLEKLRPPSRWRRNWYMFAIGVPATIYIGHKLTKEHGGFYLMKQVFKKLGDIFRDHVSEPLHSIYQELVKGRLDVTDRKARMDAIESLKRMIHSWLDENYPKMDADERASLAEAMDISLIEEHMEESIKYIYEAPALVRMSLIEMQFIKKELLNALVAMDELMGSNEMNMQVAAMTPAVILLVAVRRTFLWLFYSIFREGRSRDDVYATVRQIILDIERLLVMRDNPPQHPDTLNWGSHPRQEAATQSHDSEMKGAQTLTTDDLGMLLLHIHECRQIIWQNPRRFRGGLLRNLTEDLAELAGERGPVSLTQQLQIVNRMSKVYLFMKPRSTFVQKL